MFRLMLQSLVLCGSLLLVPAARAQAGYEPGHTVISAGIGSGVSGIYGNSSAPFVAVSAEFGLGETFSLGGTLGLASSKYSAGHDFYGNEYSVGYRYTVLAVRGSYHFGEMLNLDKLDAYAGASLGFNRVSVKAEAGGESVTTPLPSYVLYGVHLGGRYFFAPRFAGFVELGYGVGNLSAGLSMRF